MKDLGTPTLAEDLLLVLFQPDSGVIAGEPILHYVLAAAVLAELSLNECVTTATARTGSASVEAVAGKAPTDDILRSAWDHAADKPCEVQTLLAAIAPTLCQPLLERLLARGDLREKNGKVLGMLKTTTLKDGGNGRRSALIRAVRNVLVDEVEPTLHVSALVALMSGSGLLHQFDPEIPWNAGVIARARELERGEWRTKSATQAATRAKAAMIGAIATSLPPCNRVPG